ncbi:unnamed protein product [Rhodiola kirilowii]
MRVPPGFYPQARQNGLVCKIQRIIYGLKQASRQWFSRFSDALVEFSFVQSLNDYSLFTLSTNDNFLILLVYVDDVVITGTSSKLTVQVKQFIHDKFQIKDLGNLKYFLGLKVARSASGIFLNQRKYGIDILDDYQFTDCKSAQSPMETKHNMGLSSATPLPDATATASPITRLDLAFPVHVLNQFMQCPTEDHLRAAHRVLRYIKLVHAQGLLFLADSSLTVSAYCDAEWVLSVFILGR